MISDLESMFVERLQAYKAKNNTLPARVLVYRDGVSEGQFKQVLDYGTQHRPRSAPLVAI